MTDRSHLRHYATVLMMWQRGFDTNAIAHHLKMSEAVIERWVWNFREQARAA